MAFVFQCPEKIIFGCGVASEVGEEARRWGERVLLVVGKGSARRTGALDQVVEALVQSGLTVSIFEGVESDPSTDTVHRGTDLAKEFQAQAVVALGGGSVIDAAKAIALLATNPGRCSDYERKAPVNSVLPLIAIPTTAGAGSEVTRFAVISDLDRKVKMVLGGSYLIPKIALLDPLLTVSMPPEVTAATGMDALTHAIEAYLSTRAQPDTDLLALSAVELIAANLTQAVYNPQDVEARSAMLLGQYRAGLAFSNASVALVHSMSRPLGVYFGVPHGLANALLLPHVMAYNRPACPERFAVLARALGEETVGLSIREAGLKAVQAVRNLVLDIGIPRSLQQVGVKEESFEIMAKDALEAQSTQFNPRRPQMNDVITLYGEAYQGLKGN